MKIERDGKEYELTSRELAMAAEEFVKNWMKDTLVVDFELSEEDAEELAEVAYDYYCEGDNGTEYECVEKAYDNYKEEGK